MVSAADGLREVGGSVKRSSSDDGRLGAGSKSDSHTDEFEFVLGLLEEGFQPTAVSSSSKGSVSVSGLVRPSRRRGWEHQVRLDAVRDAGSHDDGFKFGVGSLTRTMTSSSLAWG